MGYAADKVTVGAAHAAAAQNDEVAVLFLGNAQDGFTRRADFDANMCGNKSWNE